MNTSLNRSFAASFAPQRWGFWGTCAWLLIYVLVTQLVLTTLAVFGYAYWHGWPMNINTVRRLTMEDTPLMIQISMWVNLLSLPLIILMVKSKSGSVWRDYMAWRGTSIGRIVLWVIICLVTIFAMSALHQKMGWGESGFMDELAITQSPGWMFLSVAVVAPIFEEMVFRGFAYGGFERSIGAWPAVILSSVLFTALHMQYNPYELLQIFALGVVLALARMRTQSLLTPIMMHAANNALATFVVLYSARMVNGA